MGERTWGFAGTQTDLACQMWDLMEAHCGRRTFARWTAATSWAYLLYPPVRWDGEFPLRGPTDP